MPQNNTAYISKITLPSGTTYNIKDEQARSLIQALSGGDAVVFAGVSSVELTDGGNQLPVIDGETKTPEVGQLFFYQTSEFIWGADNKWHALGDLHSLGDLAYKDNATTDYTPHGTISQPTFTGSVSNVTISTTEDANGNYTPQGSITGGAFTGASMTSTGKFTPAGSVTVTTKTTTNKTATVSKAVSGDVTYTPEGTVSAPTISVNSAGSTTQIKNPTSVTVAKTVTAAAPGQTAPENSLTYYSVSNETLSLYQLGYTTGDSITTANVTVKTGDASYSASQPNFTGTGARLVTGNIEVPNTYDANFSGSEDNLSVIGTTTGSVSNINFTGTKVNISGTTTPSGTVSQPTFTGMQGTITVS